jgi:4-alpha-glucanotransferase
VLTLEDGHLISDLSEIPGTLPLGWHRLAVGEQEVTLVVVPTELPEPPETWGWMLQLYALHSAASWGVGDLGDLRTFVGQAGHPGLVLLNPLHAITPTLPVPPSPYAPSSRRFANPLYLRVSDTAEYRRADPALRAKVDALKPAAAELIDYSAVWQAKRAALEMLWPLAGEVDLTADPGLLDFARFCALAELHGANWQEWPAEYRRPDSPAVRAFRSDRIAFHAWLQRLIKEQLDAVKKAAGDMPVGIVLDLAVGTDPSGADGWLLQDVLAKGVHIGAPPDAFNQLGQDWGAAAWRPDRLIETGYAAYRDMLRRIFASAGGLRVDHVMGLFRLWWVPPGTTAAGGTYVHYDADAMLGVLALEAVRAGALIVGEDLGTVEARVRRDLESTGVLGSEVLWFQEEDGRYLPPDRWRPLALATVTTHDLPTAAGFLSEEHVRVRAELDQLAHSVEEERERVRHEREGLLAMLRETGLLDRYDGDVVLAMHGALAASPCRLVLAAYGDAVGDVRQPNLPGTVDEYPNWRLPIADGSGRVLSLEELLEHPGVRRLTALLAEGVGPVR